MGQYVFAYAVGGILLLVLLILLAKPIKWTLRLVINSALGCAGLMIFNLIGGLFGLYIGVNIATAVTVGILGLPGLALLLVLQYMI
ncbi:MAG: pro-sigmaK processing inhibitor BofA family protein [Clostridiales bacterium]|jgi:inhibitor of the pro-sigma K processing machinery|nr:pro-sigmaK processing inhibitor BofA family protein [Clostridiales bacterium]